MLSWNFLNSAWVHLGGALGCCVTSWGLQKSFWIISRVSCWGESGFSWGVDAYTYIDIYTYILEYTYIFDISMTQGNVTIAWRERGGTFDNGDQGFGTELMRAAMRGLGGTIEQAWRDGERVVTICLARDHLTR